MSYMDRKFNFVPITKAIKRNTEHSMGWLPILQTPCGISANASESPAQLASLDWFLVLNVHFAVAACTDLLSTPCCMGGLTAALVRCSAVAGAKCWAFIQVGGGIVASRFKVRFTKSSWGAVLLPCCWHSEPVREVPLWAIYHSTRGGNNKVELDSVQYSNCVCNFTSAVAPDECFFLASGATSAPGKCSCLKQRFTP